MKTNAKPEQSPGDGDFSNRHAEDLSASRFVKVKGLETLIPLASMGIGGAIGFYTLGKPLAKLFPTGFGLTNAGADFLRIRIKEFRQLQEISTTLAEKAGSMPTDMKAWEALMAQATSAEAEAVRKAMHNAGKPFHLEKWAGAAILGTVGSITGSVFVGYDKWRKEESARLAASEIDRDIARLELFKPSDPELVAENKRLRGMIAEAEAKHTGPATPSGHGHAPSTAIQQSEAEHHGALETTHLHR